MRGRILIVDDDPGVRALYERALQLDGHATQTAESAQQAIELIHDAPPDGILLDLRMPFISGVGFLYRLREIHPQVPVAVVTGVTDIDDATREEIRTLGATLHHKPLPMADVQTIARQLITRQPGDAPPAR